MGLLNTTVNLRTCVVCQRHGLKPPLVDLQSLTYDYVCPTCNPNTTISVTDVTFGTNVLEALKDNPEARSNLREEISAFQGEVYRVDTNVVQYFLDQTKHKQVTYHEWISGNLTGDVRNWTVSSEDLNMIKMEQKKIFEKMVAKKLDHYKESFDKRRANSINPRQMLVKEIEDVTDIITKGRYKFQGKPANEGFKIGAYPFRGYPNLTCVQDMYEAAIDGSIDFGIVPSENQRAAVAGMKAKVDCMVQAFAFGKLLEYLNSVLRPELSPEQSKFDNILNNANFRDGTVINIGGTIRDVKITIKKGDFESVRKELAKTGLDDESINELQTIIDDDNVDVEKKQFGSKVKAWMGKAFMKAVEGSWKIGQSAAGKVLADVVMDYYGWS